MDERLKLTVDSGDLFDVREFTITEALSTLFEVNLLVHAKSYDIDLEAIVGKPASLRLRTGVAHVLNGERTWKGVCSRIEEVHAEKPPSGSESYSTYHVRIVPVMWLLTQTKNRRIFQRKTIPEIARDVLASRGVKAKEDYARQYLPLDYVVQYDETDFAFVNRIFERAGITYSFEFPQGDTQLVVSDHPVDKAPRPPLRFADTPNLEAEQECVSVVKLAQRIRPGRVTVRDFDFRRKLDFALLGEAKPAPAPEDFYEQYHYEPGASVVIDAKAPDEQTPTADDKGKVRHVEGVAAVVADQLLASERRQQRRVYFETNCVDLPPGTTITIKDHPRDDVAGKLLVTDFVLEGEVNGFWSQRGEAVFADKPYRPAMKTPRPCVPGLETAVVVGPSGQEIHTDEFGRVRVKFPWDRSGRGDDETSCWIRVSQGWAGTGYGTILIPRIGQEVLVSFFEGDPDKPVIVGRLYNAQRAIPKEQELPRYQTRSTLMTNTSPAEDNAFNEIRFEDAEDSEFIYIQAQRDLQKLVKRNETERTGQNRAILVGGSRTAIVGATHTTLVGAKYSVQAMEKPVPDDLKILKLEKPTVKPLPTKLEMIEGRVLCTSGKATAILNKSSIVFEAKGNITFRAKGGKIIVQGGPKIKINS